jgi:transcriptional regulator GlxA family with amidase domain
MRVHEVAVLASRGVVMFDAAIPCQVLAFATLAETAARYRVSLCAVEQGPVQTSSGFLVNCDDGPERAIAADTVVVPGTADNGEHVSEGTIAVLRAAHARGARIVSICTGAFALAAAGLLDGRRATTHWASAERLAAVYPSVEVDPGALYLEDGPIFTSAGLAAGIDLCLHLVRLDYGAAVANLAARRMVVAPHRSGGQSQFIERPVSRSTSASLAPTRAWMLERLTERTTLGQIADHASMSVRTLSRRFVAETGMTPLQWLLEQRVRHAQELLESTDLSVEQIAGESGFGSVASLRERFRLVTGTAPLAYRRSFKRSAGDRS